MSARVETISPWMSVQEAAHRMLATGLTALCVIDPPAKLVGILALNDILRAPFRRTMVVSDRLADNAQAWSGLRVEQVMRRRVATIEPSTPLILAAAKMVNREMPRLPVVEDGQLVGIISPADIVSILLRRGPVAA
jgi:CBS domain-containing protein